METIQVQEQVSSCSPSMHKVRVERLRERAEVSGRRARQRLAREYRKSHYRVIRFLGTDTEAAKKWDKENPIPKWAALPDIKKK